MKKGKCKTCRHFDVNTGGSGICRLNPPVYVGPPVGFHSTVEKFWEFPIVNPNTDWCSRHKPAERRSVKTPRGTRHDNSAANEEAMG